MRRYTRRCCARTDLGGGAAAGLGSGLVLMEVVVANGGCEASLK
jgi:hypothetical protein